MFYVEKSVGCSYTKCRTLGEFLSTLVCLRPPCLPQQLLRPLLFLSPFSLTMASIYAVTSSFAASPALAEGGRAPDLGKIGGGPVRKSTVTATKGSALPLYHQFDRRSDGSIFFHWDQASVDCCLGRVVSSRDLIWLWDPGPRWWLSCFLAALSLMVMVVVWGCAHVRLTTEDMLCVEMGFGGRLEWWLTTAPFSAATSEMQTRSMLMAAWRWRDWMPNRSWVSRSNLAKALGCCWDQIRIHSMGLTSPGGWIWDPGDAMMLFNSPVFFSLGMLVSLSGRLFASIFYKESQYIHAVSTTMGENFDEMMNLLLVIGLELVTPCFGSLARLSYKQLIKIAHGLENSKQDFVWIIGKVFAYENEDHKDEKNWLVGFEKRMRESQRGCDKGMGSSDFDAGA
ncbi:uncharacterized protein LOC133711499 [Rosa rugosa]|uniref:uncharacterized protein LOC133711499 n=1 Tax=Rosa rugosa TaxID=74645 RepID=UPI002B4182CE|nr:uncharacterized protein LOC133711499 [Rosa rugosa]